MEHAGIIAETAFAEDRDALKLNETAAEIRGSANRIALPLAPSLERRRLQVYLVLMIADALALLTAFMAVSYLYFGEWMAPQAMLEVQLLIPVFWTIAIMNRSYSADAALKIGVGGPRVISAMVLAAILTLFLAFVFKSSETFSRVLTLAGTIASVGLLLVMRDQLTRFAVRRCGPTAQNRLVLHDGGAPIDLPFAFHLDAREQGLVPDASDPHALDRIGHYFRNMDKVVIACLPERRAAWAMVLKGASVTGEIVDSEVETLGVLGAHRGATYSSLVVSTGPLGLRDRVVKRVFDLGFALLALLVLSPLLVLVALAIKLEDGGPILFRQRRTGRGNTFFSIIKFRSMRTESTDSEGAQSTGREDVRITRVGRFIRRTSIDELPQLLNVVRGEMSVLPCN